MYIIYNSFDFLDGDVFKPSLSITNPNQSLSCIYNITTLKSIEPQKLLYLFDPHMTYTCYVRAYIYILGFVVLFLTMISL